MTPRANQQIKHHWPAANTAATVTFPGVLDRRWRIDSIFASYDGNVIGLLTVTHTPLPTTDTPTPVAADQIKFNFTAVDADTPQGIQMPGPGDLVITLSAIASRLGKLNVIAHLE